MAVQVTDCLVNVSSTSEQIEKEEFERDFSAFASTMTLEDWTKINRCLEILHSQPDTHTELADAIQCGTKRKRGDSESSSSSTLTTISTSQRSSTSKKKPRAKICGLPLQILEETFSITQFVVGKKRRLLAEQLGLTDSQIGNWFEYRRRRMRKAQNRVSKEKKSSSVSTKLARVDLSSTVKQEKFDSFSSTSPVWQPEGVIAFDATSNSPTGWTWADSVSLSEEIDFNSKFFDSTMSPESQFSVTSEDAPSWPGSLEENEEFFGPHGLDEDFNLLPVLV